MKRINAIYARRRIPSHIRPELLQNVVSEQMRFSMMYWLLPSAEIIPYLPVVLCHLTLNHGWIIT